MGRRNSTLSGFKDQLWSRAAPSPLERALIARQRLTASINPSVIPVSEMQAFYDAVKQFLWVFPSVSRLDVSFNQKG